MPGSFPARLFHGRGQPCERGCRGYRSRMLCHFRLWPPSQTDWQTQPRSHAGIDPIPDKMNSNYLMLLYCEFQKYEVMTMSVEATVYCRRSESLQILSRLFFEEFSMHLEDIVMSSRILLIVRDFNFNVDSDSDNDAKNFAEILQTNNM